jgi:uncharacterized protein (DUF2342 family)
MITPTASLEEKQIKRLSRSETRLREACRSALRIEALATELVGLDMRLPQARQARRILDSILEEIREAIRDSSPHA